MKFIFINNNKSRLLFLLIIGIERIFSILINHLLKEKKFLFYLITKEVKQIGEYPIPKKVKRISLSELKINLTEAVEKKNIDKFFTLDI